MTDDVPDRSDNPSRRTGARTRCALLASLCVHAAAIAALCHQDYRAATRDWRGTVGAPLHAVPPSAVPIIARIEFPPDATIEVEAPPPPPPVPPLDTEAEPPGELQLVDIAEPPTAPDLDAPSKPLDAAIGTPVRSVSPSVWSSPVQARPSHATPSVEPTPADTDTSQPPPASPTSESTPDVQASSRSNENTPPDYPLSARRRGIEGVVVVLLRLDCAGSVLDAAVEATSGNAALDEAALAALRSWRFQPARRGGIAVASTHRERVVFRIRR